MFIALFGAVESGIIYAIMALGVYLTFRVLDFPDLTVDGSFVTGAAVASISIVNGIPPIWLPCLRQLPDLLPDVSPDPFMQKGILMHCFPEF